MPKKTPNRKNQTSFQKGNKKALGNKGSKGQNKYDSEERLFRKIDTSMVVRYFTLNSHLTVGELKKRLDEKNRKNISMLEYMVIRCMVVTAQTGDTNRLDTLLDRLIGKVPQKITHGVEDPYEGRSTEELEAEKRRLEEINRRTVNFIEKTERVQNQNEAVEAEYRELEASGKLQKTDDDQTDPT